MLQNSTKREEEKQMMPKLDHLCEKWGLGLNFGLRIKFHWFWLFFGQNRSKSMRVSN